VGHATAERLGGGPAADGRHDRDEEHAERVHERRRLEQCVERALILRKGAERGGVGPLEHRYRGRADCEQRRSGQQHDLRLEGQPLPAKLPDDVADDREPQAPQDDQQADRHEDEGIVGERREAPELTDQVEAGVVERRDRVKEAPPRRSGWVLPSRGKGSPERDGSKPLCKDREHCDAPDEARDAAEVEGAGRRLHEHPIAEPGAPSDEKEQQQGRPGHEAEAADLNEDEDDRLPERTPVVGGVDHGEACDADGRGRGEQRHKSSGGVAIGRSGREHEQHGAGRHQRRETEHQDERWGERAADPFRRHHPVLTGLWPLNANSRVPDSLSAKPHRPNLLVDAPAGNRL
jgi:hypothetical protein